MATNRPRLVLFGAIVLAFLIVRNVFFLLDNFDADTVVVEKAIPHADSLALHDVTAVLRVSSHSSYSSNSYRELIEHKGAPMPSRNISHVNKTLAHPNQNETEHTMRKANMSHVGEIVRMIQAQDKNPSKLAKPHPFKYVINRPNLCGKDDVFILVYIHTAPDHHKRRTVIRQTWGNLEQYSVPMRLVFVMGLSKLTNDLNDTATQKAVFFESEQYGDIVQEDFLDTYHNLTHKGVTALKWITNYCSQAVFILKTDDDIFVNTYTLIRHLQQLQRNKRTTGMLMCAVWYEMTVLREGKWKVTVEEWPNSTYPTYCSGSAFILSTDVAIRLYEVSYHVPFFWVDDFYITGLLPLKAHVTHTSFGSTFVLNGDLLEEYFTGPQWYLYIFSHLHSLNRIQAVWDTMTKMAKGQIAVTIKVALPGELESRDSFERKMGVL